MVNVLPEHVYLVLVAIEHLVPAHEEASRDGVPLTEVIAKSEDWWEWGVAGDIS